MFFFPALLQEVERNNSGTKHLDLFRGKNTETESVCNKNKLHKSTGNQKKNA